MGNSRGTVSNLKVVKIDQANNILYISGAVPGAKNGLILIYGEGDLNVVKPESLEKKAAPVEAVTDKKVEVKAEPAGEAKTEAKK